MFFERKIKSRIPVSLNFLGKVYQMETKEISKSGATVVFFLDDLDFYPEKNSSLVFFLTFDLFRFGKVELCSKISEVVLISGDRAIVRFDFSEEPWTKRKNLYIFLKKYYSPRYTVNQKIILSKSGLEFEGKMINISNHGAFIETEPENFSNKEDVTIHFDTDFGKISILAKVEWRNLGKMFDKPNGVGIQFIGEGKALRKIQKYIGSIEKENEHLR
ncbi:MAG: PilZ domain-containing protein [Leptospiraceae bacterium]|nr:PilZ domain-containing protein [Leptospiraceae bacterium]MCK6380872.1 PilZ domain-containing protein [Leptospiraceae bacterium]NUM41286.1 PilZ domain-containing protein [Leptospiraceae bacterium]